MCHHVLDRESSLLLVAWTDIFSASTPFPICHAYHAALRSIKAHSLNESCSPAAVEGRTLLLQYCITYREEINVRCCGSCHERTSRRTIDHTCKHGEAQSPPRSTKGVSENFRRRKDITFMEKADELRSEFDSEVYVLVRRNGRLFNYASRDGPSWPFSLIEVVSGLLFNLRPIF